MNDIKIREADCSDSKDLSALAISLTHFYLVKNTTQLPNWLSDSFSQSQFIARLSSEEYTHFVAEIDHEIVGFIAIKHPNHLYHLFVDENYHGKGVGKQLWHSAFEKLHLAKQEAIIVRASLYAVPIYQKFGFVATDTIKQKDGLNFLAMQKNQNS